MASCNITLKRPHFFQFIWEEYPGKRLWIPRKFMRLYGGEICSRVKVRDPKGRRWRLELSESDGEFWFQNGWKKLADYYSLKNGHLLVFKYMGNSCFSLVILDKTATEITYDPIKRTGGNVPKIKSVATEKSGDSSLDASAPSLLKKRKEPSLKYASRPASIMSKNPVEDFKGLSHNEKDEENGCKRDPEVSVPDSDFKDFEQERQEQCFQAGQVWAVYDLLDVIPRLYARISEVFFDDEFKVKVTWLVPNPDNKDKVEWVESGLPTPCCGTFKHGTTDYLDRCMFSHLTFFEKGGRRNAYKIFPRKGETWAVFRNNEFMNWKSNASNPSGYIEYDLVEILSEYREGFGVFVAYLRKIMGFVSIFCQVGNHCFSIAEDDLHRFSHKVPSLKLIENEKLCAKRSF